jgi:hypothetical protein
MRWMSDLAETELKSPDWNPSQLALYFVLAYGFSLVLWLPLLLERNHSGLSFSIGPFTGTGRCEKNDFQLMREFGAEKSRSRMPSERPLRCRHTFGFKTEIAKTPRNQFLHILRTEFPLMSVRASIAVYSLPAEGAGFLPRTQGHLTASVG